MIGAAQASEAIAQTVLALPEVATAIGVRFYPNTADANVTAPYGRYYLAAGSTVAAPVGPKVSAETLTFTVELLDRGASMSRIKEAAAAIQTALHRMQYETTDGYSVGGEYLRSTSFPEPPNQGTTYVRLAGDFEIFVGYP